MGWFLQQGCSHATRVEAEGQHDGKREVQPGYRGHVLQLLRDQMEDDNQRARRSTFISWHGASFVPFNATIWRTKYPVKLAKQQIIREGETVVPILLDVLSDANQSEHMHNSAALDLAYFDDPRVLRGFYEAATAGRLSGNDLVNYCLICLPSIELEVSEQARNDYRRFFEWLRGLLDGDINEIRLTLLDKLIREAKPELDHFEGDDARIVRWLNRFYGQDVDDLLKTKAPNALAFRIRELAKGFDPFSVMEHAWGDDSHAYHEPAFLNVYPNPLDRLACRNLFRVLDGEQWDRRFEDDKSWKEPFKKWYWENRDKLKYDPKRHQFLVPR
jgi:hypothetical protein